MLFDAYILSLAINDIASEVGDGRVDKIIQTSDNSVALTLRIPGANRQVLLSVDPHFARAILTTDTLAKAFTVPSSFIMLLRKHLTGSRFINVERQGYDRIARFTFQARVQKMYLILELLGSHGNIILVDDTGMILGALKLLTPGRGVTRIIAPHCKYSEPPRPLCMEPFSAETKLDPFAAIASQLDSYLSQLPPALSFANALVGLVEGVSPLAAKEAIWRVSHSVESRTHSINSEQIQAILGHLRNWLTGDDMQLCSVTTDDGQVTCAAFNLTHLVGTHAYPASVSELLASTTAQVAGGDPLKQERDDLIASIASRIRMTERRIQGMRTELAKGADTERLKLSGDLLLAYAHSIDVSHSIVTIADPPFTIELNPTLTAVENAQSYYARYRKARSGMAKLPPLIRKSEVELVELAATKQVAEHATGTIALRDIVQTLGGKRGAKSTARSSKNLAGRIHKGQQHKLLTATTVDGLTVYIGRNARENEHVTFEVAMPGDIWFHAHGASGSHVVLKTAGCVPSAASIEQAASHAAYYSGLRSNGLVGVDIVDAKHVRRIKGGKPGLVRIENEMNIAVPPLPVAKPDAASS